MPVYLLAFLIGVTAGLRAMTPLAVVSWAARLGWLHLENTPLAFFGLSLTPYIFSLAALGEIVNDKLPKTPSRKAPAPFVIRVVVGIVCGAAIGAPGVMPMCALAGAIGAVVGTLGGFEFRRGLVKATGGKDLPIALLEDAIAICGAFWTVSRI